MLDLLTDAPNTRMDVSIIEIPIKPGAASVVPAHPPKILEDGGPSSWVHKRKGKNKG
jgi:hypothetical protein